MKYGLCSLIYILPHCVLFKIFMTYNIQHLKLKFNPAHLQRDLYVQSDYMCVV